MNASPIKPRFLSQLAHDLRSPLNVVASTITDLLKVPTEIGPDDQALMLTLSQRAVGRLVGLSDRLSLASRVGNGLEPALQTVDLVAVTKEVLSAFSTAELRKRIEVVTVFPEQPVRVLADPQLLSACLRELISNANRYTRRTFRIEVVGGPNAGVIFEDDGEGITAEERPMIFEAFAERKSRTGLGMGLWLAKAITEAQGGTLAVEHLSPGTRQVLHLPVPA